MADVLFVVLIIGLFALGALLVAACDRIIGPAELAKDTPDAEVERAAA